MPELLIAGTPAGAGNLRRSPSGGLYNPDKATAPWKSRIETEVSRHLGGAPAIYDPVALMLRFYLVRPASHFKKSGGLTAGARRLPTVKPDADKLARAVLDALTGVLYADDSQVVALHVFKHYAGTAGLRLTWDVLDAAEAADVPGDLGELAGAH